MTAPSPTPPLAAAPPFGRPWLAEWLLDPTITYLNHGTVGATPRRVLAEQQAVRDAIERQPAAFLLRELWGSAAGGGRLRAAARAVATFVGAREADLVFVDNATTGVNAVVQSFPLRAGEEILVTDLGYGGVVNAARHAARRAGAAVRVAETPEPLRGGEAIADAILAACTDRTRLAIVDHVTSESALVLPIGPIVARLRARGIATLVDGAHAPGALPLDLDAIGADYYTANLHKWAWAPRSSGFLHVRPERQADLHPNVMSWGLDGGFVTEFEWIGTRDPSPFLAAPAAIAMLEDVGLERVRAYNHALAWSGAQRLCARWGTSLEADESLIGCMATVPLPAEHGATREEALALREALLREDRIEVQMHAFRGRIHARISGQIYNDAADIDRLADAVAARRPAR